MGKYDEVIGHLSEVDDDTLNSTHAEAKARIAELRPKITDRSLSAEELSELAGLKDAFTAMNGEVGQRSEKREADYAAADELAALAEELDTSEQAPNEAETEETPEDTPEPAAEEHEEKAEEPVSEPELVAASATPATPKLGDVTKAAPKRPEGRASMTITAAADVHGFAAGQELAAGEIGRAVQSRLRSVKNSGQAGDGESVVVASITANDVPDDRVLKAGDSVEVNTNKIRKVTSQQAITAAGGLCAPLAIDYNYGVWGTQGRPIKNSLPGFQVERGGIQYRRDLSPMLNTATDGPLSATGRWSMADDEAADDPDATNPPLKQLWVVDCPPTETASVEAITLQIEFGNISSRFDPETLQANTEAALIWHDRVCENNLWAQLAAKSKTLTSAQVLGATRSLLVTLDKVQAYYRSVHRLGDNIPLRAIMPSWARALIRSDIARQMTLDGFSTLNVSDAQINGFFATRNLTPVWHLDGHDGQPAVPDDPGTTGVDESMPGAARQQYVLAEANDPVPNYPAQVDILMHPEGHFQHLDGGVLDLGIVRDAQLIRRNRYRQFSESFEGVAARGVEALRLIADAVPNGAMSGVVDPTTLEA